MNQPCPVPPSKCFPCNPPLTNLSAEHPDQILFYGSSFNSQDPVLDPPVGVPFTSVGCLFECVSSVSQADADLCAQAQQIFCNTGSWKPPTHGGGPPPVFFNQQQSCAALCPDGSPFTFTVPAGKFAALSQALADRMAHSYACRQARLRRFCLSALSSTSANCNQPFNATVNAVGPVVTPCTWQIVAGALPTGLTLGGFSPNIDTTLGPVETIKGTPTQGGTSTFTLQCTGSDGSFMQKQYTVTVSGCQSIPLLDAYWTLDEASGQARIDSVHCLQIVSAGTDTVTAVPGLFNNGIELVSVAQGIVSFVTSPSWIPQLRNQGKGFSFFGWFKILSQSPSQSLIGMNFANAFTVNGPSIEMELGNTFDPQVVMNWKDEALASGSVAAANVPLNTWNFFNVFYDLSRQQIGVQINNGVKNYAPGTQDYHNGLYEAYGTVGMSGQDPSCMVIVDEIGCKMSAMLTDAEVSYLYNNGSGRTMPSCANFPLLLTIQNYAALFAGVCPGQLVANWQHLNVNGSTIRNGTGCCQQIPYSVTDFGFDRIRITATLANGIYGPPYTLTVEGGDPTVTFFVLVWSGVGNTLQGPFTRNGGCAAGIPTLTLA